MTELSRKHTFELRYREPDKGPDRLSFYVQLATDFGIGCPAATKAERCHMIRRQPPNQVVEFHALDRTDAPPSSPE